MPLNIVHHYRQLSRMFTRACNTGNVVDAFITEAQVHIVLDQAFTFTCLRANNNDLRQQLRALTLDDSTDPMLKATSISVSDAHSVVTVKLRFCRQLTTSTLFHELKGKHTIVNTISELLLVFIPEVTKAKRRTVRYEVDRLVPVVNSYAPIWGFDPKEIILAYLQLRPKALKFKTPVSTDRHYVSLPMKPRSVLKFHERK